MEQPIYLSRKKRNFAQYKQYLYLMQPITLSIITVNYNNNEGLKQTLRSVTEQSYVNYEHIIIDANSTDGSKLTIEKYAQANNHLSFWVSEKDNGIYDGMNKGIKHAQGEYILFLNSGDYLNGNILKDIDFDGSKYIYGNMILDKAEGECKITPPDEISLIYLFYDALPHQSCFIHHSLFETHLYDTRYKIVADWAHYVQSIAIKGCSYKHISQTIAHCDATGISSDFKRVQDERIRWFKENFSPQLYTCLMDTIEYYSSDFKIIIPKLNHTRNFQKRMFKLVKFFFKLNNFFSNRKSDEPNKELLYHPRYRRFTLKR